MKWRELALWQYLAALVLIAHGIGHTTGVLASWTSINAGFDDKPWIFSGGYRINSGLGKAWGIVWIVAMVLFIGSGIGILMDKEWWRILAITGSIVSIMAIVPWWNTVIAGAKAGVALDVAILLVLLLPWGEKITDFFEVP